MFAAAASLRYSGATIDAACARERVTCHNDRPWAFIYRFILEDKVLDLLFDCARALAWTDDMTDQCAVLRGITGIQIAVHVAECKIAVADISANVRVLLPNCYKV